MRRQNVDVAGHTRFSVLRFYKPYGKNSKRLLQKLVWKYLEMPELHIT